MLRLFGIFVILAILVLIPFLIWGEGFRRPLSWRRWGSFTDLLPVA